MTRQRGRALGLPFSGATGPFNAITDVAGVEVGMTTLIAGEGPLRVGHGPVRTGVTAILPCGRAAGPARVWGGLFALNGNGEMTGSHWLEEAGWLMGPVCISNTHAIGTLHQATVRWIVRESARRRLQEPWWALPVVAETCDGVLNDMNGFHVEEAHVLAALDQARGGPVAEGNVGGGTGMIAYNFKGGTGTASRRIEIDGAGYMVGALVQANHGRRPWLTVLGVPVGEALPLPAPPGPETGSVIAVVVTDAPLLPGQLKRIARRISIGIGRGGTPSGNSSGDIFLALSTANREALADGQSRRTLAFIDDALLDPLFLAAVEAVEESVVNAMLMAETMTGRDGITVEAIDPERLLAVLRAHGRTS